MSGQQLCLKTVDELRVDKNRTPLQFYIPAYQRGYRWWSLQVTQLLDDIREFMQKPGQPDEFYCLQPLVIKVRADGKFEVVDGQQRMTTLLLILRHFNERLTEKYRQTLFDLAYETRPGLDGFFQDPSEEAANDNADYFHLYHAIRAIEDWFNDKESEVESIKSALLNDTKVIWYELADSDNAVDAFTRLNVGKIPLTNEELIRALFLRRTARDDMSLRNRIANEWDQLEKGLQSDDFWYFLSNRSPEAGQSRIGFIFDLVARAERMLEEFVEDEYGLFYAFNNLLKEEDSNLDEQWLAIKRTYMMLEEWFEDRTLYHMVGFLISQEMSIEAIQALSQECTKSIFEQRLREEIYRCVIDKALPDPLNENGVRMDVVNRLDDLSYGKRNQSISAILLLFNLATLLQDSRSNLRFQFDSFKTGRWEIEHIRSVGDDKPERHNRRRDWLQNCLEYLKVQKSETELCGRIEAFLELSQIEATNEGFDALYEEILQYFGEETEGEAVHEIANLALLDEHTNRSYKNAPFAIKRHRLLALDQHGIFVPLCTRNVFLKCYSPQVGSTMFWGDKDQQGYQEAIIEVLTKFFCGGREVEP